MAARNVEVSRVSPGSAFKIGLIMGLLGLLVWLIAVTILYIGMDRAGIVDQVNSLIGGVGGDQGVGFGLVFSAAGLVGVIGTVMIAVLSPLIAVIYNAIADLLGGLNVTLTDTGNKGTKKSTTGTTTGSKSGSKTGTTTGSKAGTTTGSKTATKKEKS